MRIFSSSLWLCDCLLRVPIIRDSSDGNSMGLILDARNVHSNTFFGSEHSYLRIGFAGLVEQARFIQPIRGLHDEIHEIESSTETV
jgi:hypothetical protein